MTATEFHALAHAIHADRPYEYPLLVLHCSRFEEPSGSCSLAIAPVAIACTGGHYLRPTINLSGTDATALREVATALIRVAGPFVEQCDAIAAMKQAVRSVRLHHGVTLWMLGSGGQPITAEPDDLRLGSFLLDARFHADGDDTEIRLYDQDTGKLIADNDVARVADLVDGKVQPQPRPED